MPYFNPSSRKPCKLKRYCSSCKKDFLCDGSCGFPNVINDKGFCYCPPCWKETFHSISTFDEVRKKCQIVENYLKKIEKDRYLIGQIPSKKDFARIKRAKGIIKRLGDDY